MDLAKSQDKELYLKKHIFAIHSKNNVTLLQRKIYNFLLFNASYLQNDQKLYTIHLQDVMDAIQYNSKDFKTIKNSIKGLTKTTIEWNVIDEQSSGEIIENTSTFLAGVSFKKNVCTYEYSEILKQLLLCPLIYGKICLNIQARLTTSSGLALYENCNRYRDLNFTPWLNLDVLGKLLGFDSEQLPYKRIKARYINKAIQDVNSNTDIAVDLVESKKGKTVDKVKFKIKKNAKNIIKPEDIINENDLGLIKLLKKYGFAYKDSVEIIKTYEADIIINAINYVINQNSFKEGKVKNVSGYIIQTLKNNYQPNVGSNEIIRQEKKQKYDKQKEQEDLIKKQDHEYSEYLLEITNTIKARYSGSEMLDIIEKFKAELIAKTPLLSKWAKNHDGNSFENKAIDSMFSVYLRANCALDVIVFDKDSYINRNIQTKSTA